jgi:hypothetical protein
VPFEQARNRAYPLEDSAFAWWFLEIETKFTQNSQKDGKQE